LGKAFKLQMDGDNWGAHFRDVRDARRAFKRLAIPAERIEDVLWNSIFVMSVASTGNNVLRMEIDNVLPQQVWPQMDDLIARWTKMLTAKETMTKQPAHGIVQANVANTQMQRKKQVHRSTRCINCGKAGHMIGHCVEALSKCAKCSGSHHTTMHDEVQIIRKAREDRIAKVKPKQPEFNSPKERMNRMGLNADVEHGDGDSVNDAQIKAMIAIEESIREEEEATVMTFLDEDAYITEIIIAGVPLDSETVSCRLAELEKKAERISEDEAITAMKALRVMDEDQDEVIFDTGCTAHVLKAGEGLFDLRKAPACSCIKGVGGTATITHVGKMLGIGRVFVAPEGANLISWQRKEQASAVTVKNSRSGIKTRP
jgi:hypothetical protein